MKKSFFKLNIVSYILLLFAALALTTGMVLAWFIYFRHVADTGFTPGTINPALEMQYWNKDSEDSEDWYWDDVPSTGMTAQYNPYFGVIDDLSDLVGTENQQKYEIHLRMRVSKEETTYSHRYEITLDGIAIDVYRFAEAEEEYQKQTLEQEIDYYSDNIKCFQFSYYSSHDMLKPDALADKLSDVAAVDSRGQSLSANQYIGETHWLYIKLTAVGEKVLNVIRSIPPKYMPYSLEFVLTISSEARTTENETD